MQKGATGGGRAGPIKGCINLSFIYANTGDGGGRGGGKLGRASLQKGSGGKSVGFRLDHKALIRLTLSGEH